VGLNRFAYSANDPVNLSDPGGNASAVSSLKGGDCDNALDGADKARNDLISNANKAHRAIDRIEQGKGFGVFSGLANFKKRFEKSYGVGNFTADGLNRFAEMANSVANGLGPRGEGVTIEHYGIAELSIREALGASVTNDKVDYQMSQLFGMKRFKNRNGLLGSYTSRDPNAAGWASPGSNGPIALDNGYNSEDSIRALSHEGAHAFLGLADHHDWTGSGYGADGIQDALKNGLEWNNADNFACVIQGC